MKVNLLSLKEGLNEIIHEHNRDTLGLSAGIELNDCFNKSIRINAQAQKVVNQFFFTIRIETIAQFTCDRCLEVFDQPVTDEFKIVFSADAKDFIEPSDDSDYRPIATNNTEIDLTTDIREALLLIVPMKTICSENCKGLCSQCGINLNIEACDHGQKDIDPRWEALKNIKN